MNPQNPQPQNQGLDPSIVALTKAIGQQESGGNYNSPQGKNGETGAYQMTPGFIQNYAPKFLPNYKQGQSLTPAQQDELAYNVIKEWGTSGDPSYPELGKLTPAQIASAWNSGDPNAYLDEQMKGTNAAGASYNVPNYVSNVGQNYDKNMGIIPTSQAQKSATPQPQGDGTVGGNIVNTFRNIPKTGSPSDIGPEISTGVVQGLGGIAQGALDVGGALANVGRGLFGQAPQAAPQIISPQAETPQNVGEMAGNVIGGALAAAPLAGEALPVAAKVIGGGGIISTALKGLGLDEAIGTLAGLKETPSSTSAPAGETTQSPQAGPTESPLSTSTDIGRSAAATGAIKNAIETTLNSTQTGRVFSNTSEGKNAINTAAAFGLITPDENGNLQFNEERRQEALKEVANLDDKIIASENGSASPLSALNYAGQYIGNDRFTTPLDKQQAAAWAQKEVEARGVPLNEQMSLSDMREAQKQHYAAAKGGYGRGKTSAEILAHKALANGYGQAIRARLADPELHDRALAMERALIQSEKLGKKLQGKRAPVANGVWEKLLRQGARAAEIYIGDKIGGPVGAVIGGFAGEGLNRRITRHFGRNIFETKGMRAAMDVLHETKPQQYNELVAALKQQGIPFTPEQEPENQNFPELVKDVGSDLKTIGDKGLVKAFKKAEKKSGLIKPPKTS